jgi:hypothetical protein
MILLGTEGDSYMLAFPNEYDGLYNWLINSGRTRYSSNLRYFSGPNFSFSLLIPRSMASICL